MPTVEYWEEINNEDTGGDAAAQNKRKRKNLVNDELQREKNAILRNKFTIEKEVLIERLTKTSRVIQTLRKIEITYYSSGNHGSYIRNALTGQKTQFRVGSSDEHEFFTIAMCPNLEFVSHPIGYDGGSVKLFYASPSEFEKHQFEILSDNVKSEWIAKQNMPHFNKTIRDPASSEWLVV